MKKRWMIALAVMLLICWNGVAHAGQVVSIDENRTFRLSEEKVLLEIPGVPKGVSAEQAQALVEGKIPPVEIPSETKTTSFAFPWVWEEVTHSKSVISYDAKGWHVSPPTISTSKSVDWVGTILLVWLLPSIVGIAGLVLTQLIGIQLRWLPLWYLGCCALVFFPGDLPSIAAYFKFFLAVEVNSFILAWGVTVFRQARKDWREAFSQKSSSPDPRKSPPIPNGKTKTIIARDGDKIVVDISDEAIAALCKKAGINPPLKSGQRFDGRFGPGTVEGVASGSGGNATSLVLWGTWDTDDGKSAYCHPLEQGDMQPL